jgi:hypothetical protein
LSDEYITKIIPSFHFFYTILTLSLSRTQVKKIKELADANAYARQRIMQADGALEMKLKAQVEVQKVWADAFSKYTGAVVPQIQTGGGPTTNGALNFMDIMTAKTAKDFALDLKNKN